MKVVTLLGSPREKGNSAILAGVIEGALSGRGHETVTHRLNNLDFKGCQACGACKQKREKCVIRDDLAPVLDNVHDADIVILASPVYWGDVSAQMKGFIDRIYSFLVPGFMTEPVKHRLLPGKKLVFILTQAASAEMYDDVFPRYNSFFQQLEMFDEVYFIRGCGVNEPGEVNELGEVMKRARDVAGHLLKTC